MMHLLRMQAYLIQTGWAHNMQNYIKMNLHWSFFRDFAWKHLYSNEKRDEGVWKNLVKTVYNKDKTTHWIMNNAPSKGCNRKTAWSQDVLIKAFS